MLELLSLFGVPDSMIALIEAALVVFAIGLLLFYLYTSCALFAICKKTDTKQAWISFVPGLNIYIMARVAGVSSWYVFSIFLAFIPVIGPFITLATVAYIWTNISEKLFRPAWWGWLMVVPGVNLVFMGVLAWGKTPTFADRVKPKDFLIEEKKE